MSITKPRKGKSLPYFVCNHKLPGTFQYYYPIGQGGHRWMIHKYFMIRDDMVQRVNDPVRCKQNDFLCTQYLDDKLPRTLGRDDLQPVLDYAFIREAPERTIYKPGGSIPPPDDDCLEDAHWWLTILPPDMENIDPSEESCNKPNLLAYEPQEDGTALCAVSPLYLGWCLFRFQDFNAHVEWLVSLKEAAMYLREDGEIKAIVMLCQVRNPEDIVWEVEK